MTKKIKGLFFCSENCDFTDPDKVVLGVGKKILAQVQTLNNAVSSCLLMNLYHNMQNKIRLFFQMLFLKKYYISRISHIAFEEITFVYIRRFIPVSRGFLAMLAYIKLRNPCCKIIYEVPTYPYDSEHKGLQGYAVLLIDILFRTHLKKYVDYITTYSLDTTIFGIKTIKLVNGVDCAAIPVVNTDTYHDSIRLVAVAQFSPWHGYDRLIAGLRDYYRKNQGKNIYIDFIGSGSTVLHYSKIVKQYGLEAYVIFHGFLTEPALSKIFDKADIAVCSLGCHRIGIFNGSFLKSREYLARGLPMISSTKIDILPPEYPYIHYVPEDETAIDIPAVIDFYEKCKEKEKRQSQICTIRAFAEQYCDIHNTMLPVLKLILDTDECVC